MKFNKGQWSQAVLNPCKWEEDFSSNYHPVQYQQSK